MQRKPFSRVMAVLLSWLAFGGAFFLVLGIVLAWPWMRGASDEQAGRVLSALFGGLLFTAVALGLTVRDLVARRLSPTIGAHQQNLARAGCLFVALPASFIAFFRTCAPLGLIAGAESSVRPIERSWSNEIMFAAWTIGVVAALLASHRTGRGARGE